MIKTVYQKPEIRDSNDNIIQQGAFGKNTALANATNDGWIDYVANDLEFLYGLAKDEVVPVSALPASGDMNKTYLLTTNGKTYRWSGTAWVELTNSEAVGRAEAAASLAEQWATKTDGTVADNEYSAKHYSNVAKDWANKLNATVDGSEYSAKHYAGVAEGWAEDAEDTAEDIADHLAQIDQNTGGISANSKRIGNIEKLLQGNLYDYQTDSSSAYTKTVPSGAMPYAGLEKVGGKTIVMNQLITDPTFTDSSKWGTQWWETRTFSNNTMTNTVNTATNVFGQYGNTPAVTPIANHKYYVTAEMKASMGSYAFVVCDNKSQFWNADGTNHKYSAILTNTNTDYPRIIIQWAGSKQVGDSIEIRNFFAYDLTLMFGVGNEPSTVAEFESMFPASYYSYNEGTLLSAGVTEVVSKDSNNATLQTYSIPASIQALEGYGWSAGTAYNYVDFERKVFVKNVARVDIGTITWHKPANANIYFVSRNNEISDAKYPASNNDKPNMVNERYIVTANDNTNDKHLTATQLKQLVIFDSAYATDSDCQTAVSGVYLYYELETPQEIDISQYLTDDNLISVESGGTLTFPNSNGDDYQIPVPSEEEYMIDLQEAINNG